MGHLMHPIPFDKLIAWARQEYAEQGAIFGIRREKFYAAKGEKQWFSERLGTVLGPAAGPHSQLAQNIVAAYLAGARFIELKTVQKMDGEELRACIPRPCINAEDEGYNVEWSTELTVEEAFDEYLKGWFALHVLQAELGLGEVRDFTFNMSVGYDLEGIKLPKIDNYIEGLKDASNTPIWNECVAWIAGNVPKLDAAQISPQVCTSITLSTLHGCPPDEIERIARYLIEEKGLTTFIKCNPTLLGYETARQILDEAGYTYLTFDDHHFKHDLQFTDAVPMLKRLQELAGSLGLGFGVKLTNTFPVKQKRGELPGEEMYMSGRPLLPLTLTVAKRLSEAFDGKLPIGYSGGADAGNIDRIFAAGIYPITVCTTLLKPGGYERLTQLASLLEPLMSRSVERVDVAAVAALAEQVLQEAAYQKGAREYPSRKTDSKLGLYDCYKAPCKEGGCPIEQQIPEYLGLVGHEKFAEAMEVIAIDNAAPAITGVICAHPCQSKCTRMDYESPIRIRGVKRVAVEEAMDAFLAKITPTALKTNKKAVVIGAGPGGIAAGLYLRRNGMEVTVRETRERPFGMVEYVIPEFRIGRDMIDRDYEMAVNAGVKFEFGMPAEYCVEGLKKDYDYVIIATGAWGEGQASVKEGADLVVDSLILLADAKANGGKSDMLGKRVAIIGGGDVAMDAARVAARNPGTEEAVIVYRRTQEFMPAQKEEIREALEDGVVFMELVSPLAFDGKTLTCEKMALGDYDASGRRAVVSTGETVALSFDTVITAVGATVDTAAMAANGIALDGKGYPALTAVGETSVPGVYVAGDCRRGPATIVQAMGDAKVAAIDILGKEGIDHDFVKVDKPLPLDLLYEVKGVYHPELPPVEQDYKRCLACDQLCELCNDVCPNRANVHVTVDGGVFGVEHQILHLDGMCNECGNCATFCPHDGSPYLDKVTVFWAEEAFADSENRGFLALGDGRYRVRTEDGSVVDYARGDTHLDPRLAALIAVTAEKHPYYLSV
ncbi:MAG: putative selenate reductase subunit YgfK [Oscillospiraceae bacterium]|nr:putative selenate reductase subunit YgfK [Oscillospiraceae bacterium]